MSFSFRVKIREQEIEISGTKEEVMKTIEEFPKLIENVLKAFESTKNREETSQTANPIYPYISSSSCREAVLHLLASDWGRQPRSLTELREALKSNAVYYPSTTF